MAVSFTDKYMSASAGRVPRQHACFSRTEMPLHNIAQPDMHIKENLFCACCHDKIGMLPRGLF
jgi:hypothetical protein